jgi:hypothetical protein
MFAIGTNLSLALQSFIIYYISEDLIKGEVKIATTKGSIEWLFFLQENKLADHSTGVQKTEMSTYDTDNLECVQLTIIKLRFGTRGVFMLVDTGSSLSLIPSTITTINFPR